MQNLLLIADDFALSPAVSRGILDLLGRQRLSGAGAMTTESHWPGLGRVLAGEHGSRAELGLHLNLTLGAPLGPMPGLAPAGQFPGLGQWLAALADPAFPVAEVDAELARQFDAFTQVVGRAPDFVDGHQHVHVLPRIRSAVLRAVASRGVPSPWLRDPGDSALRIAARGIAVPKAQAVAMLAAGFGPKARRLGLRTNRGFAGFSPFDPTVPYRDVFRAALRRPGPCHAVMCHPGFVDEALAAADPVIETRPLEHAYLASEAFTDDMAAAGFRLGRFPPA